MQTESLLSMAAASLVEALVDHQAGRLAEAERLYRHVLALDPGQAEALRLLGVLRFQRGDPPDAELLLRQAAAAAPDSAKVQDNLAVVLHALKRDEEALTALRRAVALDPGSDAFQANLGNLLLEMGRHHDAVEAFRRAVILNPAHAGAHQHLGSELLKLGHARDALSHFAACTALGAANSATFAHQAVALTELGDLENLHRLVDFDRLVVRRHIGDDHGYPSLQAFNAALAKYVADSATLHVDRTTVNGLDTAELLSAPDPSVTALRRFVYAQIEERLRSLPAGEHPFAATAPRQWRTESWGVKMWRQGYQVTHIHQKAWLSGVYYVQLPEMVRAGQQDHDGWIEFGRGPEELYVTAKPETRLIQPVEGMLITFPSYVWHRTIPFESDRERISIAFDVIKDA
jgi:Flp pilus assembly protein TadD